MPTTTSDHTGPPEPMEPATAARAALRVRLTAAMKQRDRVAAGALRAAIGAVDNAEAVDAAGPADPSVFAGPAAPSTSEHVAGTMDGVGAAEVVRRRLSAEHVLQIIDNEVADRLAAVPHYTGDDARVRVRAADLRHEADTLTAARDEVHAALARPQAVAYPAAPVE